MNLEEYLKLLDDDQTERRSKIDNFSKFVNKNDYEGLFTLGRTMGDLDKEWKLIRIILANIRAIIKEH